jgi:hypothetical protein
MGALMMKVAGFSAAWIFAGVMAALFALWAINQLRSYGSFIDEPA